MPSHRTSAIFPSDRLHANEPTAPQLFGGALLVGLLLASAPLDCHADTIHVPTDYPLIQDAINAASDGDIVQVGQGRFEQAGINLSGRAITIQGTTDPTDGSLLTTIVNTSDGWGGDSSTSVFLANSGEDPQTVVRDLIISRESSDSFIGGMSGIRITNSGLTITGCVVLGHDTGISAFDAGQVIVTDSTISHNATGSIGGGGGISISGGTLTLTNCEVLTNEQGVSATNASQVAISNCIISENGSSGSFGSGTGITVFGGALDVSDCEIARNADAGVDLRSGAQATVSNCVISENGLVVSTTPSSGIAVWSGTLQVIESQIHSNRGSGVELRNTQSRIERSTIWGNGIDCGAGVRVFGSATVEVDQCQIFSNVRGPWCFESIGSCEVTGVQSEGSTTITNSWVCSNQGSFGCPNGQPAPQVSGPWTDGGGNSISASCVVGCCTNNICLDGSYSPLIGTIPQPLTCMEFGGEPLWNSSCEECLNAGACCMDSGCTSALDFEECTNLGGSWTAGASCDDCPTTCPADLNHDGSVDGQDLAIVLGAWGLPCDG